MYIYAQTIEFILIPKVSAAIITPPLNVIPNTDVPVTIGCLKPTHKQ